MSSSRPARSAAARASSAGGSSVRASTARRRESAVDLRWAAATLGAPPLRAVVTGLLPALRRPLAAGAGLAAAVSLGEFGASSVLSRSGGETLPVVIGRLLARTGGDFQARGHALAVVLAATTVALVAAVDRGSGDVGVPRSDDRAPRRRW